MAEVGDPWQAVAAAARASVPERPPINLHEYEAAARAILPRPIFDFIAGGAEDEATLAGNRLAFDRWRLLPRVLRGIPAAETVTTLFGRSIALPAVVSPMGGHRLVHEEGDLASARGVKAAGTILIVSTASTTPLEQVAAMGCPWWFQVYVLPDRQRTARLVRRAEAAGAKAIVLTVDVQQIGRREANQRNRFELPAGVTFPHLLPEDLEEHAGDDLQPDVALPGFYQLVEWDAAVGWDDLSWLVDLTELPVLVKGVLHPDDARAAVERGARGVIVSNHGGRQLDQAVAALDALPAVAAAVGGRATIVLDGGVRRGTDVLKALALGADAVSLGRPVLWALATDGEAGVRRVLDLLRAELALDLLLAGKASVAEVDRSLVVPVGPFGATNRGSPA